MEGLSWNYQELFEVRFNAESRQDTVALILLHNTQPITSFQGDSYCAVVSATDSSAEWQVCVCVCVFLCKYSMLKLVRPI